VQGDFVVMTIANMNKQATLYSHDYRVHFRAHPSMLEFEPVRTRVSYNKGEPSSLRFSHKFDNSDETFFAFCIPWSCEDNQRFLDHLDATFAGAPAPLVPPAHAPLVPVAKQLTQRYSPSPFPGELVHNAPRATACSNTTRPSKGSGVHKDASLNTDEEIYYHRQTLAMTLQGRTIDVITISDFHGWHSGHDEPQLPGVRDSAATWMPRL
jgi:hypothetical protein